MPTTLPDRSDIAAAARRLSWRDTARFLILLVRVRWLNWRLTATHQRLERDGLDAGRPTLLRTARRRVVADEAVNDLLGTPELAEVGQLRALMRGQPIRRDGADA